ncbi:MAG: TldD/PmbA family protein [Victivallales bacterium]|nr:TldD/PmbA family protein [Victivallales bacterium]
MRTSYIDNMKPRVKAGLELAEQLGASAARITFNHGESRGCSFESGRLKNTESEETLAYHIMVIVNGRRGNASGNIPEAMESMVRRAIDLAQVGANAHYSHFPKPSEYAVIKHHSDSVLKLTRDKMIADCQEIVDYLKGVDDTLDINSSAWKSEGESLIANNAGMFEVEQDTHWSLGGGVQKTTGTDMLFAYAYRGWQEINGLYDKEYIKQTIATDLQRASRMAQISDGSYPLIIPPQFLGRFLSPVIGGMNGRNVYKGTSPLKEKLGKQIAAANFTLEDNPFVDFCPQSGSYDGAGIAAKRRYLVKDGVLQLFLYDLDTAGMAGTEPTGNDNCSPYAARVLPGTETSDEMFKSVKRGLYIKQLLGFGQGNLANGDFSANVALGYVIENGEIVGRLKNAMVAGNIFDLLMGDIRISSDLDAQINQPYMLIPNVSVVSAKG